MIRKLAVLVFVLNSFVMTGQSAKESIPGLMREQQEAWNKGDIEAFMQTYWKNDSLKFIGSKGLTYGWQNTLDNYRKSYPDKATMGTLQFDILSIDELSETSAVVVGKWYLKRDKGDVGGHYTLLWKKIDGKWVIVADHTS